MSNCKHNVVIFSEKQNDEWSKKLDGKTTSSCIAILCKDEVLMVKAAYKDHWTFPSGVVENGESPLEAAIRETKEETGIAVSKEKCSILGVVFSYSNGSNRERFNFCFIIQTAKKPATYCQDKEIESFEWVKIANIAQMSNNRPSYTFFQKHLANQASELYHEVH